ncbi:DEAD-box ATP-dependent RNA helicase 36, partial [Cucurbita argyrosperma subsp. sororia]
MWKKLEGDYDLWREKEIGTGRTVRTNGIFEPSRYLPRLSPPSPWLTFHRLAFPDELLRVSWRQALNKVIIVDENFPLFSKPHRKNPKPSENPSAALVSSAVDNVAPEKPLPVEKSTELGTKFADDVAFANLGLSEAIVRTCEELAMKKPTAVQTHCIPKILAGLDVLGIAQTGSGKTAAFALPILQRLSETHFGIFALVINPTRELEYQLAEQFRALGSGLNLRCSVVVGGMDMLNQTQSLLKRPHIVIATPGRVKVLLEENPDIHVVFSKTKLIDAIEANLGKQLEIFEFKETEEIENDSKVRSDALASWKTIGYCYGQNHVTNVVPLHNDRPTISVCEFEFNAACNVCTQVYKASYVAKMKMVDDGFEEKAKERKKTLAEKGLLKQRSKRRRKEKTSKQLTVDS